MNEALGDSIANKTDVNNQQIAEFQYNRHLKALGVTQLRTEPTPEHRKMCYDACIYEEGKWTGVIEIRSVNYRIDQIESFGGFMIDVNKMTALRKQFYCTSEITGKSFWSKEVVFLFRCVKDNTLWATNIRRLAGVWNDLEDVPTERLKNDHGAEANKTKLAGKLIPPAMMERIE